MHFLCRYLLFCADEILLLIGTSKFVCPRRVRQEQADGSGQVHDAVGRRARLGDGDTGSARIS